MSIDDMEIATGFKVRDWKALQLRPESENKDWEKAVHVFKDRIFSRFIEPVDILIAARGKKVGFAVLALDFIVIETLQAFIKGDISRDNSSELIKDFFITAPEFKESVDKKELAKDLYDYFRCGILHQGQTGSISKKGELFVDFRVNIKFDEMIYRERNKDSVYCITINRTKFHEAVTKAFNRYSDDLLNQVTSNLRGNFIKKMNTICGIASY